MTEAPVFYPEGDVVVISGGAERQAGQHGRCPQRDGRAFATRRHSKQHRIRALDAYAISTQVLDQLADLDVETVFIVEKDTGDVFEYDVDDFTKWGDPVPEKYLEHTDDPQRYHARDDPKHRWRTHQSSFYEKRETPDDPGFTRASEVER